MTFLRRFLMFGAVTPALHFQEFSCMQMYAEETQQRRERRHYEWQRQRQAQMQRQRQAQMQRQRYAQIQRQRQIQALIMEEQEMFATIEARRKTERRIRIACQVAAVTIVSYGIYKGYIYVAAQANGKYYVLQMRDNHIYEVVNAPELSAALTLMEVPIQLMKNL